MSSSKCFLTVVSSSLTVVQIPRRFVPAVNRLLESAAALAPGTQGDDSRLAALGRAQRRYNRRVEGFIRARDKHGLKHKPNNTVEVSSLPVRSCHA